MIIPSLDYIQDNIVRLYQGNYSRKTLYRFSLLEKINQYFDEGATYIHLVDLYSCKNPNNARQNIDNIFSINKKIIFQVGGGIRLFEDIKYLLSCGVSKIVVGTTAIIFPKKFKKWLNYFGGDKIILAVDVQLDQHNNYKVAINGWQKITNVTLEELIKIFLSYGLKNVLCTDISRDGTFLGPNFNLYTSLVKNFPQISFQASGGINSINDIKKLKNIGVSYIIIGKALLEKKFTLPEAIKCWQSE